MKFHKMTFSHFQLQLGMGGQETNITGVDRLIVVLKASQTHQGTVLKKSKKNTKLLSQETNEERSTRLKEETWMILV